LSTASSPPNYAKVARWYGTQEPVVRSSLEKAEPFTWLKHLDKRGSSTSDRLPWHLSALIIEEYLHAEARQDSMNIMNSIPEDSLHDVSPPLSPPIMNTQLIPNSSRTSSNYSLGQSLTKQSSLEGRISFEPLVESTHHSMEVESRRRADSFNSPFNSSANHAATAVTSSPNNSRSQRDFATHVLQKLQDDNRGIFSAEELRSDSDHNRLGHLEHQFEGNGDDNPEATADASRALTSEDEYISQTGITVKVTIPTPGANSDGDPFQLVIPQSPTRTHLIGRRRVRTSLPSVDRLSRISESKRQQLEAEEANAHELKTR
jgi:hypothetical protein